LANLMNTDRMHLLPCLRSASVELLPQLIHLPANLQCTNLFDWPDTRAG